MADFREVLHVSRSKDQFGNPSYFPQYDWSHTKIDLADGTVQIIDFGTDDSIGKICQLIDDFESTEQLVKLGIRTFLQTDRYYSAVEY